MNFALLMIYKMYELIYKLISIKKNLDFMSIIYNIRKNLHISYNNALRILLKSYKKKLFTKVF